MDVSTHAACFVSAIAKQFIEADCWDLDICGHYSSVWKRRGKSSCSVGRGAAILCGFCSGLRRGPEYARGVGSESGVGVLAPARA